MSFLGLDPGDHNNWYQSPQLGLFPVSLAVYGGGISGGCYSTHSYHPHGSPSYPPPPSQYPSQPSYPPSQFPSRPSYPPLPPPPSQTIINGYVFPHQFPHLSANHTQLSTAAHSPYNYPCSQNQRYSSTELFTTTPQSPLIPLHPHPSEIYHHYPPIQPHFIPTKQSIPSPLLVPIAEHLEHPQFSIPAVANEEPSSISLELKMGHRVETNISTKRVGLGGEEEVESQIHGVNPKPKNPVIEADSNLLEFGSIPATTVATSLTASGDTSLLATATAGGSIRILKSSNINSSHHEVILGWNDDIYAVVVSGSSSEGIIDVGITDKLNVLSNNIGVSAGNRESEIQSTEGAVVTVKSIGKLRDGKEFFMKGHGEGEAPFEFKKDEEQVIEELDKAVVTMRKVLDEASLPSNFMDAIMDGVLCSIEAVTCIPQCLYALCLNNNCFQAVKDRNALRCFVKIFTLRTYLRALTSDKSISFSSGLGELMRYASSLHGPDLDMLIEILNAISNIGHRVDASLTSTELLSSSTPVPRETDGEERNVVMTDDRESSKMNSLEQGTEPSYDSLVGNAELLFLDCVSNVARLLETILQNGDTCRIIGEKKRIEAVLQLFNLLFMPQSVSVSQSIFIAFKNIPPQHYASLAWAVCSPDNQSRSHLLQWFTLYFELCNWETMKEPPHSCRKVLAEISQIIQTLISQFKREAAIIIPSLAYPIDDQMVGWNVVHALMYEGFIIEFFEKRRDRKLEALKCIFLVKEVHGSAMRRGLFDLVLPNAVVNVYGQWDYIDYALVESKDVASWMSMVSCYVHNGLASEALELCRLMKEINVEPDHFHAYGMHDHGKEAIDLFKRTEDQKIAPDHNMFLAQVFHIKGQMETDDGLANHLEKICLLIAMTIVQLYSKEAAEIYKKLNMMTRSAYEFVEMWRKGIDSSFLNASDHMNCLTPSPHRQHTMKFFVEYFISVYSALTESDQLPCLQALEVILVECSAALYPWMFVVVSKVLMFTTYGVKDVHASHLFFMRNINAPDQFVKAIRSTANGKAMMELNMGLYTDIGLHDFSLDSQRPTLGFELLFAKMKFRNILCLKIYMVASGATTQGHMLHDKVIEFSFQLNQGNECTALGNYGRGEMKRLEQETNEKCVALAIIPMGNTDLVSEEIEQPLFLNVIFQVLDFSTSSDNNLDILFDDVTIVGMLKTSAIDWLLIVPCLLTIGDSTPTVITWLSKLKAHSQSSSKYTSPLGNFSTATMELLGHIVLEECEWVVIKSVKKCYDDKPGEWGQFTRVVNVNTRTPSHHLEAKVKATQMTNLQENGDLFLYFLHWGITLLIFYFQFVYNLFIYGCCWYNILGVAYDNMMIFKMLHIVDFCEGKSLGTLGMRTCLHLRGWDC